VYGNAPLIIPAILSNGAIFAVGVLMCMCVYVETMRLPYVLHDSIECLVVSFYITYTRTYTHTYMHMHIYIYEYNTCSVGG
jgi:hypothetical protein